MSRKILLVDDDDAVLLLARTLLEGEGYAVGTAKDGATAILAAQRSAPELIVVDIGLPGGDGISVLRRLRMLAGFRETPVIVLTGKEGPEWRRRAEEVGASYFMTKPIDKERFLSLVRKCLPERRRAHGVVHCPQCGHAFDPFSGGAPSGRGQAAEPAG